MSGWGVVLRGIRYRPGRSLVVLLLAAITVGVSVLAPAYSRAAQQSVLTDSLAAAPSNATSLHLTSGGSAGAGETDPSSAKLTLTQLLAKRPTLRSLVAAPIGGASVDAVATAGSGDVLAQLSVRDNVCAHLTFTVGACPTSAGEAAFSARSAAAQSVALGSQLQVHARGHAGDRVLKVVGLYQPSAPASAYWGEGGYFADGGGDGELTRVDAVFLADPDDLALPGATPTVDLDLALRVRDVSLDDVAPLRADLGGFTTDVNAADLQLNTALPSVLDDIDASSRSLARTVPVIAVPLVIICFFILFLVVAALAEERGPEVALARLRGYPPARAARFGRAEALTIVLAAVPVGVLAGVGLVELIARTMLSAGVHVELRPPVFITAGVAALAAFVAVRLGGARLLTRPVLALLRRVPARGGWRAGVVEGVIVAFAAASLIVAVSDQTAPLALLAPALLALVAGVLAARALGLWSRVRLPRHTRRGRITGVLAHAQLSRRSLGHRVVLVVTVAVALLSFAATAWDAAAQARQDVATDQLGAARVLRVNAADPTTLMAATAAADPAGTIMPVVRVTERYGDGNVELLGVDSSRFAGVAQWRGHRSADLTALAGQLEPEHAPSLTVHGWVDVAASASAVQGAPTLAVVLAAGADPARTVRLGTLAEGTHHYRATVDGCPTGCRLLGLAVVPSGESMAASLRVLSISGDAGSLNTQFANTDRWRVNPTRAPSATVHLTQSESLGIDVTSKDPGDVVVDYVDTPDALPVVVAGGTPSDDPAAGTFTFPALGEQPQRFSVVDRVASLPRAGAHALLFDLGDAVRAAQRSSGLSDNSRLRYEVWAGPEAPADLASRLAASGVTVIEDESITATEDQLAHGAPALGLRLALLAGAAAMLLAIGAVLLTAYVGAATRRNEFAALRVAGVRPATLRRSLLREYAHLLGVPLVVGVVTGVAAALLMLPGIPLVEVGTATGVLTYSPTGAGVLGLATAITLVGLLVAVSVVLGLVRRATPERLREGGLS